MLVVQKIGHQRKLLNISQVQTKIMQSMYDENLETSSKRLVNKDGY